MQIIQDSKQIQAEIAGLKMRGKSIGFVPTMGALHAGHLSLVKAARKENAIVVVSIFVNPTQFGANEDLSNYPRTFEADIALLKTEGVDYVFAPQPDEIYGSDYATYINVESKFTEKLCGAKRPGHFRGVATIVGMLFNICLPDKAYFGLKDYQQVLVIKRMVKDLRFPVAIVPMPIYREDSGLAMSSRNKYLTENEKKQARALYESLLIAKDKIESGKTTAEQLREIISEKIMQIEGAKIDYIEVVDPETLEMVNVIQQEVLVALAVFVGKARLIDNMLMGARREENEAVSS